MPKNLTNQFKHKQTNCIEKTAVVLWAVNTNGIMIGAPKLNANRSRMWSAKSKDMCPATVDCERDKGYSKNPYNKRVTFFTFRICSCVMFLHTGDNVLSPCPQLVRRSTPVLSRLYAMYCKQYLPHYLPHHAKEYNKVRLHKLIQIRLKFIIIIIIINSINIILIFRGNAFRRKSTKRNRMLLE